MKFCGAGLAVWMVVATGLWTLRGPSSGDALVAAVACVLALMGGLWLISGRFHRRSASLASLFGIHAFVGLLFGSAMVLVTYAIEAADRGVTLTSVAREATYLGAEYAFWIWLYAVLAASAYGVRAREALRDAREREARTDARLAEARLAVLRGQLNPHFLFNALHSVRALISTSPDRAGDAIDHLGDLLRYSLSDADQATVSLGDEAKFTDTYLDLVALSMGDRLRATVTIDEDVRQVRVPPFSLQVLAENAVRHGLAPRADGGTLEIRGRRDGTEVEMLVINDGSGTSPARSSTSGGLANLRARLEALYPGRSVFEAKTRDDGGFVARIVVPAS